MSKSLKFLGDALTIALVVFPSHRSLHLITMSLAVSRFFTAHPFCAQPKRLSGRAYTQNSSKLQRSTFQTARAVCRRYDIRTLVVEERGLTV